MELPLVVHDMLIGRILIRNTRKQYAEDINLSKEKFVSILVIDGCFIIEYCLRRVLKERQETINLFGVGWSFTHLRRDLMLLENQIPFFVLFLHMKLIPDDKRPKEGEVHHLLNLQHKCLNQDGPRDKHSSNYGHLAQLNPVKTASYHLSWLFYGLLYLVFIHELPPQTYSKEWEKKETIPSATELHDSGVKFKRKVPRKDEVASDLDVSFTVEGTLDMTFFRVRQMTSSQLRNFIASSANANSRTTSEPMQSSRVI
ncbi:hypothetical protein Taro_043193 [Colocasia esculenta]|uniref:Uncharacterized protein n=1 Tax=Colocasia esculenta TaxID=4460 RepID=A0A843X065_COLES|nr:hypothetical protein [Colocasia esculenta]